MTIPFQPEALEDLKARLPLALEPVFDPREIDKGAPTPGSMRAHVFDFEDGVRLIISRDRMPPSWEPIVHVSASMLLSRTVAGHPVGFLKRVRDHWKDLGRAKGLDFVGLSPGKNVPHFVESAD